MNRVVLVGRLTKDPDLRFIPTTGTATTQITLAVDNYNSKTKEKGADFIPVVVFGKRAESLANYMIKGAMLGVSGRIRTRSYEGQDGQRRYITEVLADEIEFLSRNKGEDNGQNAAESSDMTPVYDEEIPF